MLNYETLFVRTHSITKMAKKKHLIQSFFLFHQTEVYKLSECTNGIYYYKKKNANSYL